VTVIATGFNVQSFTKKNEEVMVSGSRKENDKKVEQISMPLQFPLRREKAEEPAEEKAQTVMSAEERLQASGAGGAMSAAVEFPPFLKPEAMRKEPRVYVSKGSVVTQYEDDTDVPTFLRKQMQ
jgi:hypothetical protein